MHCDHYTWVSTDKAWFVANSNRFGSILFFFIGQQRAWFGSCRRSNSTCQCYDYVHLQPNAKRAHSLCDWFHAVNDSSPHSEIKWIAHAQQSYWWMGYWRENRPIGIQQWSVRSSKINKCKLRTLLCDWNLFRRNIARKNFKEIAFAHIKIRSDLFILVATVMLAMSCMTQVAAHISHLIRIEPSNNINQSYKLYSYAIVPHKLAHARTHTHCTHKYKQISTSIWMLSYISLGRKKSNAKDGRPMPK